VIIFNTNIKKEKLVFVKLFGLVFLPRKENAE